jgi:hypothetical protein
MPLSDTSTKLLCDVILSVWKLRAALPLKLGDNSPLSAHVSFAGGPPPFSGRVPCMTLKRKVAKPDCARCAWRVVNTRIALPLVPISRHKSLESGSLYIFVKVPVNGSTHAASTRFPSLLSPGNVPFLCLLGAKPVPDRSGGLHQTHDLESALRAPPHVGRRLPFAAAIVQPMPLPIARVASL